jgi:putative toxin-antitoxin system antitoxin component (TIGR02293 family)
MTNFQVMKSKSPKSALNQEVKSLDYTDVPESIESIVCDSGGYDYFLTSEYHLMSAVRQGITQRFFELVRAMAPFSDDDWARFLDVSTKSLQRYRQDVKHVFRPSHSEKILAIAQITQQGVALFGSAERFQQWLQTPNYALGGKQPAGMLEDAYGRSLVAAEMHHIAHGVLA